MSKSEIATQQALRLCCVCCREDSSLIADSTSTSLGVGVLSEAGTLSLSVLEPFLFAAVIASRWIWGLTLPLKGTADLLLS